MRKLARPGGRVPVRRSGKAARARRPPLAPGDTVGVVATGFAVQPAALAAGVARLERMGFEVALGASVLAREGYLAGSDDLRAADLCALLERPDVRAIWFARGGYGTARLLDRVPWRTLRRDPKTLIGYSDLTALFAAALERSAAPCFYAPVVAELGQKRAFDAASLAAALAGRPISRRIARRQVLAPGRARGKLLGGNLTVLTHLLGTPYAPDLRGAVLFLEEVGEQAYRVDRLLAHWRLARALDGLAGVLLGAFDVPRREAFPPDRPLLDVLRETFVPLGVPVVTGLRAGHVPRKETLPLGGTAEIDTAAGRVIFRPAAG